jgi:hypothetical protein
MINWMGKGGIWLGGSTSTQTAATFNTHDGNRFVFNGNPGEMPQVINTGLFNSNGTVTVDSGVVFINMGTVQVLSGALNLGDNYRQDGGSTMIASGAALNAGRTVNINMGSLAVFGMVNGTVNNQGLLTGSGTVNGNVINAGQIAPGDSGTTGILTINGDYTQTATGVLTIRIGGAAAGSGFDQLVIAGRATLDGTLNVRLINNFMPMSGNTFLVMRFNSQSGAFASTHIDPSLMSPMYDPTDVTIQAF